MITTITSIREEKGAFGGGHGRESFMVLVEPSSGIDRWSSCRRLVGDSRRRRRRRRRRRKVESPRA
jgi:hypothetical protein